MRMDQTDRMGALPRSNRLVASFIVSLIEDYVGVSSPKADKEGSHSSLSVPERIVPSPRGSWQNDMERESDLLGYIILI